MFQECKSTNAQLQQKYGTIHSEILVFYRIYLFCLFLHESFLLKLILTGTAASFLGTLP